MGDGSPIWGLALLPAVDLEYFRWWQAGLIFLGLALPVVVLGLRSLSGWSRARRWVAMGVRLGILALLVLALGGLQVKRRNRDLEVIVLRDISDSAQQLVKEHPGGASITEALDNYLKDASQREKPADDSIGVVSFNQTALIDAIPNRQLQTSARAIREPGGATDIAGAIQMGLAAFQKGYLRRLVLICDGNQTAGGDVDAALEAAAAQHVPIDVMPLRYSIENEVMVERLVTGKSWRRENESFVLDVYLRTTNPKPVTGTLRVFHVNDNGQKPLGGARTVTLEPATLRADGRIEPRLHVEHVQVPELRSAGVHEFRATFETAPGSGVDTLTQNNTGNTFVIVQGQGKVLLVDNMPAGTSKYLVDALTQVSGTGAGAGAGAGLLVDRRTVDALPQDLVRMQSYDAVILANVPRLPTELDRMLADYVHETGGGLIMVGGPDSFGAGGWQNSKLEEVLPLDMDVPAQRQIPKGALVLVMHSCEMPDGNYWGEQCAIKATEALSAKDEIGVISYDHTKGSAHWDFRLQEKRNGVAAIAAIKAMSLGDMPDFESCLQLALNGDGTGPGLKNSRAARKHVVVISDGDPSAPLAATIQAFRNAKVTVSTVPVYPHGGAIPPTMADIAKATGGVSYPPVEKNPNQLPQIFIKEAVTVRRSMVQTSDAGFPVSRAIANELVQGIERFPQVFGYVLTTKKNSAQAQMVLSVANNEQGKEQIDPLLASWQSGLGKSVAFTSDTHTWTAEWVGTPEFSKFWRQMVGNVQRPVMSSDFDIEMTRSGDQGTITVEALRGDTRFWNFLNMQATIVGPDGRQAVRLVQTGPGAYQGRFAARQAGNYVAAIGYTGPDNQGGRQMTGMSVNDTPELRDLRSNDSMLRRIAEKTGGRMLPSFNPAGADLYNRAGLVPSYSPLPVRDWLLPILVGLLLIDVAVRRIAWDWQSTRRMAAAFAHRVREWTLTRKVDSGATLDALRRVREDVAEARASSSSPPAAASEKRAAAPDPKAKFEGKGVEGDVGSLVGGATDKPLPAAPKKVEPKGGTGAGGHTGSLLEAKRRAQQAIRQKEQDE